MTNIMITRKTFALAAVVAFAAISFSSLQAHASITGALLQCKASNERQAVKCCSAIVDTQGKPYWFTENNMNCQTAVTCTKAKSTPGITIAAVAAPVRCTIRIPRNDDQGTPPTVKNSRPQNQPRGNTVGLK